MMNQAARVLAPCYLSPTEIPGSNGIFGGTLGGVQPRRFFKTEAPKEVEPGAVPLNGASFSSNQWHAYFGRTICCTVFEVPPSGGGLKTWIETARYPMIPVFCAGPGAK